MVIESDYYVLSLSTYVYPISVTKPRVHLVPNTFPIVHTGRHVRLYSLYCSLREKSLTVINLIPSTQQNETIL